MWHVACGCCSSVCKCVASNMAHASFARQHNGALRCWASCCGRGQNWPAAAKARPLRAPRGVASCKGRQRERESDGKSEANQNISLCFDITLAWHIMAAGTP